MTRCALRSNDSVHPITGVVTERDAERDSRNILKQLKITPQSDSWKIEDCYATYKFGSYLNIKELEDHMRKKFKLQYYINSQSFVKSVCPQGRFFLIVPQMSNSGL